MNEIKKIVIKTYCKLCDGSTHKSKFILKDNLMFFEDSADNPSCSMFVMDFYEKYSYKVESETFKANYKDICKEIHKLFESDYLSNDKSQKFTATIYYDDKSTESFVFYDTLETMGLNNLARLIKRSIAPCEYYPDWLEANELLLDEKTQEIIEKIQKGEI